MKLDLAVRLRQDQRRTAEAAKKKELRVLWYASPQPSGAERGKTEGRGRCGSHTHGPDC